MAITISGSGITSANIADGTIVNADIKSDAAIAASKLTGLTSPAITKVTQAYTSETRTAFSYSRDLYANNLNFVGWNVAFSFNKVSSGTDLLIQFEMSASYFRDTYVCAIYTGSSGSATEIKRFSFNGTNSIAANDDTPMIVSGHAIWTGITTTGSQTWYWALGRANDAYNSSYVLNPNTTDNASLTGNTSSHITVYEGDFS
jgi:hypothetical protein